MDSRDIGLMRLSAQHIAQADFTNPAEVVRHLLAMQAQDYNGALWAIGLRTQDCMRTDVEQAIADHTIVRTWPMRGTLHFLHADDVHWMRQLLAPRVTASAKGRRLALGLSDEVMIEAETVVRDALGGGKSMRRDALLHLLREHVQGVNIDNMQAGHIFRNFGERGIICFGAHEGKQPTFALLDEWIPNGRQMEREEALGELARRYFTSHGPATLTDLAGWGYMTMGDARKALALALPSLQTIVVSDTAYYAAPGLEPAKSPSAFLLPGFDEYILGYKDRSAVLPPEYTQRICPGNNGMFLPTIVTDGQVVGTWKRTSKSYSAETLHFQPEADEAKALLDSPRAAYGNFLQN